jgi:hypothetical protein
MADSDIIVSLHLAILLNLLFLPHYKKQDRIFLNLGKVKSPVLLKKIPAC